MICPNCGANNEDTYQFCMKCGTSLAPASPPPTPAVRPMERPAPVPSNEHAAEKDLLKDRVTPADGEMSVRTYYCTYYQSRLLGLEAWGHLGVTNKRVIFQALGTSNAGSSVIQSELPIADVSGISSYKGTFFSFTHLLVASAASTVAASTIVFLNTLIGIIIAAAALGLSTNVETGVNTSLGWGVIGGILGLILLVGSLSRVRHSIWKATLAAASSASFVVAGGSGLAGGLAGSLLTQNYGGTALAGISFFIAFIVGIYTLFCVFWYGRRPTFSLAISSKGGSNTPISISGASGLGLFSVSAGRALTAEPAPDAEGMLQELGAVILDIQMLGDMGINKWKAQ